LYNGSKLIVSHYNVSLEKNFLELVKDILDKIIIYSLKLLQQLGLKRFQPSVIEFYFKELLPTTQITKIISKILTKYSGLLSIERR
jgi:CRISPR/Cas system-associated endoribonuclease Cas2